MDYDTDEKFDSRAYLNSYYSTSLQDYEKHQDWKIFHLTELVKCVDKLSVNSSEDASIIEVGAGPCMHVSFIVSRKFKNIVLSEYLEPNRRELMKWLNNDAHAFDWTACAQYIGKLESKNTGDDVIRRTRESVKAVVKLDVHNPDPLVPNWFKPFDCLVSSLCLEPACSDIRKFRSAIGNLSKLVKKGGHFIMIGDPGFYF
jgi:hypothetical protein